MTAPVITDKGRELALDALSTAPAHGPVTVILMEAGHNFSSMVDFVSEIVVDEIAATGYARVAATFGAVQVFPDGRTTVPIDETLFGLVGGMVNATVSGCYLFQNTGNDATSPIQACVEFVTAKLTDGTDLRIAWPPETMTFSLPVI